MSFTFAIVAPPVAVDDETAWRELDGLLETEGDAPAVFRTLHDQLTAKYPCICDLDDDSVDEQGVWSDGPLWNNFGARAAVLGLIYSRVDEVLPFVIESATALGLTVFEWDKAIYRPDGVSGLVLTLESRTAHRNPTIRQIQQAARDLNPKAGRGFLIVEGPGDDYAQAAGGGESCTAEWREYSGSAFRHFVASRPGPQSTKTIKIQTNGAYVSVLEHERLTAADVEAIVLAFANQTGRPAQYGWRDVSARFQK